MGDSSVDLQDLTDGEAQAVVGGAAAVEFAVLLSGGWLDLS